MSDVRAETLAAAREAGRRRAQETPDLSPAQVDKAARMFATYARDPDGSADEQRSA